MQTATWKRLGIISALCGLAVGVAAARAKVRSVAAGAVAAATLEAAAGRSAPAAGDIAGVVTSSKGPEAGGWGIAETADLGTKFRKIVVTNERGQYLLPDLPKANYKVWVRGYGLVDSPPVNAVPGTTVSLTALVAPSASAAAEYYPASYWVSLLKVPPKNAFPMPIAGNSPTVLAPQADWLYVVKGCWGCHQMGAKATREIPANFRKFASSTEAWARFISSGQLGQHMNGMLSQMGHGPGGALFAPWGGP